MTTEPDDRLLAPYRPVRRVSRGEAPWPGMLVRLASGDSRVLVDANQFPVDWAGWRGEAEGQLLAPLDVVRRADGHSLVLPLCVERVADLLARRVAARVPLSLGEVVTLSVSLVRGIAGLDAAAAVHGEWWLTDAGRPVLASDASDLDVAHHTGDLLRALSGGSRADGALISAAEAVEAARRSPFELRRAEEQLFALAAAEPLATSLLGPRAARDLATVDRVSSPAPDDSGRAPTWVDTLARHVDADLADVVSKATTGLWRRLRRPHPRFKRPWLLAGAAAAAVLVAGLLWPTGAGGPATAVVPTASAARSASASETPATGRGSTTKPTPTPSAGLAAAPPDLVAIANRLLEARTACGGEQSCLAKVVLDTAREFEGGAIDLDSARRKTTLLDDFGGMAVLRVDARDGGSASQFVVVMLDGDRWLLRDVHAAKQP